MRYQFAKFILMVLFVAFGVVETSFGASSSGGGGSSGITRVIYPLVWVPDELLILVGHGGLGGAGGSAGNGSPGIVGQLSYVSMYANTAANNLFAVSGDAAPDPGGGGTNTAGGGGGGAGGLALITGCPFSCWGITQFIAGVNGTAGGDDTGVAGTALSVGTGCMILSGTGGGGSTAGDFAGGAINAVANTQFLASPGGPAGPNAGSPGFRWGQTPLIYGGTGGGSSNTTTGGAGGSATTAPGAGGGGGGAGVTVGGRGGDGGPGQVLMACW